VVDGPLAETKELIAGYTLIQVMSREDALDWAQALPFGPSEAVERFREIGIGTKN
jgi:hypothetical protein